MIWNGKSIGKNSDMIAFFIEARIKDLKKQIDISLILHPK